MRTRTKVWLGALVVLVFIRFPLEYDVDGTERIEFVSEVKNPNANFDHLYTRGTAVISDPEEIRRVCAMLPRTWHHPLDLNSQEGSQETYMLRFIRAKKTTQVVFTETQWSSGRTPETILEWAREKANKPSELTAANRPPSAMQPAP